MHQRFTTRSEKEFRRAAERIVRELPDCRLFLLSGPLGSGKTTFVKAAARALKAAEEPHSPTFSLLQEYALPSKRTLYHMDLYRIHAPEELEPLEIQDILHDKTAILFIEWPEVYKEILCLQPHCAVSISAKGTQRTLSITYKV